MIPFDIRGLRTISHSYDPESLISLKRQLQADSFGNVGDSTAD